MAIGSIKCMFPRRVDASITELLPLTAYEGEIELVESNDRVLPALEELAKESLLGFDTESRPSFRKNQNFPVSILQLGGEKKVWIFRLDFLSESLPEIFKILANPQIKKVGVAVNGDLSGLRKLCEFEPQNVEDISVMTRRIGIINTGLRNLAALFCSIRISKSAQMSNWAAERLSAKQIKYAATDAWISRKLYLAVSEIFNSNKYVLAPEKEKNPSMFAAVREFFKRLASKFCG